MSSFRDTTPATERRGTGKGVRKASAATLKRGQPTAAARLINSSYVKFGWHKPLSGEVKEVVHHVSSMADSMYMLQIKRGQPIEPLSMRNGIFWEHRQLIDPSILSTPAVDHIDLFPPEEATFKETIEKLAQKQDGPGQLLLHYLFDNIRLREFLLLPIEIGGNWVTIIARIERRAENSMNFTPGFDKHYDREVTDLAVVDPLPSNRDDRKCMIWSRLTAILAEGCIEIPQNVSVRDVTVLNVDEDDISNVRWMTGLVAYAVSREFIRRLKALQWRRHFNRGTVDREFLWAPFEEHYNFDAYRQNLTSACAHQCVEKSEYQVRLALEVPSEDSGYEPEDLADPVALEDKLEDEKWDVFQTPTHSSLHAHGIATPDSIARSPDDHPYLRAT